MSLEMLIDAAASAGFEAVTVSPIQCREVGFDRARDRDLRRRLRSRGVKVTVVDSLVTALPGPRPADASPAYLEFWQFGVEDFLRICDALGARVVNVAPFPGSSSHIPELVDVIGRLATRFNGDGITTSIEFMPGTGIPDSLTAQNIIGKVGVPNLGITFDTWHFQRSGAAIRDAFAIRDQVAALQINDGPMDVATAPYVPMSQRLLPGEGNFPLHELLAAIAVGKPQLRVGIEVFNESLDRLPPEQAAIAARQAAAAVLSIAQTSS